MSLLIYLDLLSILMATGVSVLYLCSRSQRQATLASRLQLFAFGTLSLSMLALFRAFLVSDFSYNYVVEYSASYTPVLYKLTGLWAGRAGTLLLWTWSAVGALCIEDHLHRRKKALRTQRWGSRGSPSHSHPRPGSKRSAELDRFQGYVRSIGLLFVTGLAMIQLTLDPFKLVEGPLPGEGYGLNPLLQTPWMAIHPPVTFIAFGLLTPVLAASWAYLMAPRSGWVKIALRWARWSWIWLAAGLVLGGYWAYVTLGWGGYWAWDPVETSNLLPWIGLTAFLHMAVAFRKKRSYSVLGPSLATLVMAMILLESFVTRGGIWVSVHAFQSFEYSSAWDRFTAVLSQDDSVLGFFILMVAVIGVDLILTIRALVKWPAPEPVKKHSLQEYLTYDAIMYATVFTILLVMAITFVLMLMGVNGGVTPDIFVDRLTPIVFIMTGVFLLANFSPLTDARKTVILTASILSLSVLGALIGSRFQGPGERSHWLIGLSLPVFVGSLIAIFLQLYHQRGKPWHPYPKQATPWTVHMIHLGMVVILFGYAVTVSASQEARAEMKVGQSEDLAGYMITLHELRIVRGPDERSNHLEAVMEVDDGQRLSGVVVPALIDPDDSSQLIIKVQIINRWNEDVYVSLDSADPGKQTVSVTVKVIPYIGLVWAGSFLIILGELLIIGLDWPFFSQKMKRMASILRINGRSASRENIEVYAKTSLDR